MVSVGRGGEGGGWDTRVLVWRGGVGGVYKTFSVHAWIENIENDCVFVRIILYNRILT